MSIVVYQLSHSPFCIPITTALRACGADFETRDIPNWDRSEIIRRSGGAYYGVPLLEDAGRAIYESAGDSQEIAQYIDRTYAGGKLFPQQCAGLHEIVINHLENDVEGVTFRLADPFYLETIDDPVGKVMTIRHKERKFGKGCIEAWRRDAQAIRAEADHHLAHFEEALKNRRFLFGDQPVYADFLLYGIIGNFTWDGWNHLSDQQKNLQRWREELREFRY